MTLKASSQATAFAKALRSLETGGLTYRDVLTELREHIETGASPAELLEILRARELIEPLSDPAHGELLGLLNDAIAREKSQTTLTGETQNAHSETASNSPGDRVPAPTSIVGPMPVHQSGGNPTAGQRTSALPTRTPSPSSGAPGPYLVATQIGPSAVEAAADARATALAAELQAAHTALGLERSRNRETAKASADNIASTAAVRARAEEQSRELDRSKTEARALREALALRDTQVAALTLQQAKTASALETSMNGGTQLEADLRAARARESTLSVDLAAARAGLESEHRKAQERFRALADRLASTEAALALTKNAPGDSERHLTEARTWRDSIAARDAELAALTREHAKIAAALDARSKSGSQLEADLQTARSRTEEALREAERRQAEARALRDSLATRDAELAAVRKEHAKAVPMLEARAKRITQLEADLLAARARADALYSKLRPEATAGNSAQSSVQQAVQTARRSAPIAAVESVPAARTADLAANTEKSQQEFLSTSGRGVGSKVRVNARVLGLGAAAIIAAVAAWLLTDHTSTPPQSKAPAAPAVASAAAQIPGTIIRDCPTCPAMTILPPGRFKQGSPVAKGGAPSIETPQHWVNISRPFAMSTNPITVGEFAQFIAATRRDMEGCDTYDGAWKYRPDKNWTEPGFIQTGWHPVTCVSLTDAESYAKWLSTKTGYRYRLPSASEWEYAARAGGEAVQPWSPNESGACANANVADRSAAHRYPGWQVFDCDDGYVYTSPVGSFKANSFGLNDMLGNVFQWTEDCWHAGYGGAPVDGSARVDGDCAVRELRGGSWFSSPDYVRANYRNHFAANYRTSSVGIRLVREVGQ